MCKFQPNNADQSMAHNGLLVSKFLLAMTTDSMTKPRLIYSMLVFTSLAQGQKYSADWCRK